MPSHKASYWLICHRNNDLHCMKMPDSLKLLKLKQIDLFFPLRSLWTALWRHNWVYKNPLTGTKKQQLHLTVRARNTSCRDVRETSPQIPPLALRPPSSHRGNMPCLSKLTTSSLQQSQQTCMGTYLSKIDDSSYPWAMTKVSGSTHVGRIKTSCRLFWHSSCKWVKAAWVKGHDHVL